MKEKQKIAPRNTEDKSGKGRYLSEITGIIAILGGLYLLVSFLSYSKWDSSLFTFSANQTRNYGGIVGAFVSDAVFSAIGFSGYLIPVFMIIYGAKKILGKYRSRLPLFGALLLLLSVSLFSQLLSVSSVSYIDPPGGLFGLVLTDLLVALFSNTGAYIFGIMLILISLILMSPVPLLAYLMERKKNRKKTETKAQDRKEADVFMYPEQQTPVSGQSQAAIPDTKLPYAGDRNSAYKLPSLSLLKDAEGGSMPSREELDSVIAWIEKKLNDFGVQGKIKHAHPGPVVTMYEFEPAAGVKINRIVSLADDLALSLRAQSIRIYPISGKATIGIEVPNRVRATVYLKDIISAENFDKSSSYLTLALGKDIFGNPVITDLAKMPHLLVAGTTGSGKSVFMNSIIISLLYKTTPDEVKMLMVDPKLLELSAYSEIPHLIAPVITNPKEASDALKKIVFEMERRYRLLAEKGARNIENYNRQMPVSERLPYIVVFIDELADLMLTAPADVENAITRLAQMARASGIHLILATQRPSVDVITGLIKANFPARISFQVTSKIDSRTILDSQGAEQLLGKGDMLFMLPGVKTVRIHGAYVSETEVNAITDFIKSQKSPDYTSFENIVVIEQQRDSEGSGERDEMYQRVIDFGESSGEVSISSIQRRFKIGYNKAARIMELLEEDNLVGPPKGAGKPRDFLGRR